MKDVSAIVCVSESEASTCRILAGILNYHIALKFNRHTGNSAADVSVKFQSDRTISNTNLPASGLRDILQWDALSDIETGP